MAKLINSMLDDVDTWLGNSTVLLCFPLYLISFISFFQVRALFDDGGKRVDEATPSVPVQV